MIPIIEREKYLELWEEMLKVLARRGFPPGSADKKRLRMVLAFTFHEGLSIDHKLARVIDQSRSMRLHRMVMISLEVIFDYLEDLDQAARGSCEPKIDQMVWRLRRAVQRA